MATVTYRQASRIYPGSARPAVDSLDLEIGDGEFLVLVGPSGCGKSTSLRMLAGLEEVDKGNIFINDRDVTHLPPKSSGHRHGVPELRVVPAHVGVRQHGVRAEAA
jgi:multiple sugar transport system ATP-binding protein